MKTSAKFKIGNEVLTLVLPTEMEAHYHTAEQKLNKLFHTYQKLLPGFSKKHIYAFIAFRYAVTLENEGLSDKLC